MDKIVYGTFKEYLLRRYTECTKRKMMSRRGRNNKGSLEDEIKEEKGIDGIPMKTWRYAGVTVKEGLIRI